MIRPTARSALTFASALSLLGSAVCGEIALLHMRWMAQTYGAICGAGDLPHCAACTASVSLLMAGLALLAAAARQGPVEARRRAG